LEERGSIVIKIDELETSGTVRVGREDKIEKARETFENALNKVLPATKTVLEKLRNMVSHPDEIVVTFGVNLSTVAGSVANFGVTVRWMGTHKEATSWPIRRGTSCSSAGGGVHVVVGSNRPVSVFLTKRYDVPARL
jgi:hypothetical protein